MFLELPALPFDGDVDLGSQTLEAAFEGATMNFTQFVSTTTNLDVTKCRDTLHRLLREQTSLQLATRLELWDLLLPIYLGDINSPFDRSRVTGLVVQVKNTDDPNSYKPVRAKYEKYLDLGPDTPLITLLVDLGQTKDEI
jgi:hypothetical protein